MSAAPGSAPPPLRYSAPLTCPSCGHEFTGRWIEGAKTAAQQCRRCGHVFEATWPGFSFQPEVVVCPPGQEPGHGAA